MYTLVSFIWKRFFQDDSKPKSLVKFLTKASDVMEKMRRIEGRVASDQDLKLSDTLRYHMRDTTAAKDLLFRRLKSLSTYENANKTLEKARAKNKDVVQAENAQQEACKNFEKISDLARDELKILRQRRVLAFQKSLKYVNNTFLHLHFKTNVFYFQFNSHRCHCLPHER